MRSRRRWIVWVLLAVVFLITFSAAGVYLLLRALELAPPEVSAGSTLHFDVAGDLPEDSLYKLGGLFFGVERVTFRSALDSIAQAGDDSRIENLLLHLRGAEFGWAKADELRAALQEFKSSGKPLVAFIEQGGNLDYFLALAADAVYLHPQGVLDLRGLQAEVTFLKSTLDKLGIEAEFEQIGAYKNAPDVFTRETLSSSHREVLEAIVGDLYARFVAFIAGKRNLTTAQVRELLDRGPFPARDAHEAGLVDGLSYRDEVEDSLTGEGREFEDVTVARYQSVGPARRRLGRRRMALIYGVGIIVGGESDDDAFFGRVMGSDTIARAFRDAREDDSIEAVVFRIDSPGGSDVASDVIWREAKLTMEKKPVVVSMSDVAASGGYWIATASHAIVAEPNTLTGSIGIYGGKFNLKGFYEKIGFNKERVLEGESADFWSDTRSFTPEERARYRRMLEEGYRRFIQKVAEARDKAPEDIDALGQGRVWTGAQALERGLVDELGGLGRALSLAKEKAGIGEDVDVVLKVYPEKKSVFEVLLRKIVHGAPEMMGWEPWELKQLASRSAVFRLLMEGKRLAIMPYQVRFH
ncbi:MAG: signal peptide peptidase SppA [Acidobacteriota bacterium]